MSSVKDNLLWNTTCMPHLHPKLEGMSFKLERWPNFGKATYNQHFIELCSLLSIQYVSKEELKSFSKAEEETINHLLNTLKAMGLLNFKKLDMSVADKGSDYRPASYREKLLSYIKSTYHKLEHITDKAS